MNTEVVSKRNRAKTDLDTLSHSASSAQWVEDQKLNYPIALTKRAKKQFYDIKQQWKIINYVEMASTRRRPEQRRAPLEDEQSQKNTQPTEHDSHPFFPVWLFVGAVDLNFYLQICKVHSRMRWHAICPNGTCCSVPRQSSRSKNCISHSRSGQSSLRCTWATGRIPPSLLCGDSPWRVV